MYLHNHDRIGQISNVLVTISGYHDNMVVMIVGGWLQCVFDLIIAVIVVSLVLKLGSCLLGTLASCLLSTWASCLLGTWVSCLLGTWAICLLGT